MYPFLSYFLKIPLLPAIFSFFLLFALLKKKDQLVSFFQKRNSFLLLSFSLLYYVLILVFVEPLASPFFLTRYLLFVVPLFLIIISHLLFEQSSRFLRVGLILVILCLTFSSLTYYYQETTKEEWDSAASFVSTSSFVTHDIMFDVTKAHVPFGYYFTHHSSFLELNESTEIDLLFTRNKPFWLILSHNKKPIDHYVALVPEGLYLDKQRRFKEIEVYHYSVKGERRFK